LLKSAVLWTGEIFECEFERTCANPVMTVPMKKRFHAELFIDKRAALFRDSNQSCDQ